MKTYGARIGYFAAAVLLPLAVTSTQFVAEAQTPNSNDVCLIGTEIKQTNTPNDRTIVFHMTDGTVWRNDLATPCPSLSISAWSEVVRTDEICANHQMIRVSLSGATCRLGNFTKVSVPAK